MRSLRRCFTIVAAVAGRTGRSVLWGFAALVLVLALGAAGFFLRRPAVQRCHRFVSSATIPSGMRIFRWGRSA
mgnify:CR=1 FL=1